MPACQLSLPYPVSSAVTQLFGHLPTYLPIPTPFPAPHTCPKQPLQNLRTQLPTQLPAVGGHGCESLAPPVMPAAAAEHLLT